MARFKSLEEMWATTIMRLRSSRTVESRLGPTKEEIGFHGVLMDPTDNWVWSRYRKASPVYANAELLWYLSGSQSGDMPRAYAPSYINYLNERGNADGAYGYRWSSNNQWENIVSMLEQDPESRQAVAVTYFASDLNAALGKASKDIPCTISLQCLVRSGKLHMIASMRSNDAWLGMPYDVFCFTSIQRIVAAMLKLEPGEYHHVVGSMHLYEKHWDRCRPVTGPDVTETKPDVGEIWDGLDFDSQRRFAVKEESQLRKHGVGAGDSWRAETLENIGVKGSPTVMTNALALTAMAWYDDLNAALEELEPYACKRLLLDARGILSRKRQRG